MNFRCGNHKIVRIIRWTEKRLVIVYTVSIFIVEVSRKKTSFEAIIHAVAENLIRGDLS